MGLELFKNTNFLLKLIYYITFFSICFYLIIHMNNNTHIESVLFQNNIIYYILVGIGLIFINDLFFTVGEYATEIMYILIFIRTISFAINYIVDKYLVMDLKDNTPSQNVTRNFFIKFGVILALNVVLFFIALFLIYIFISPLNETVIGKLENSMTFSYNNTKYFMLTYFLFLLIYLSIFYTYNYKSKINAVILPNILSIVIILLMFSFVIFLAKRLGLIDHKQYLSTFISLSAIAVIFVYFWIYNFLSSLGTVCDKKNFEEQEDYKKNSAKINTIMVLLFISIITLLWLDDSKHWKAIGYLMFVVITIFTFYALMNLSVEYPSTSLMSFWLFIEWVIICMKKGHSAKNSVHFMFLNI